MFKRLLFTFLIFCYGSSAFAAAWSSTPAKVTRIEVTANAILVELDPAVISPVNVNSCGHPWFVIYNGGATTLTGFQQAIFSAALAAKASGNLVTIYSSQCEPASGYNQLDYIYLHP